MHEDFVYDILKEAAFEEKTIHEDRSRAPNKHGEVAPEQEMRLTAVVLLITETPPVLRKLFRVIMT